MNTLDLCSWKRIVEKAVQQGYSYNPRLYNCVKCDGQGTITESDLERTCKLYRRADGRQQKADEVRR